MANDSARHTRCPPRRPNHGRIMGYQGADAWYVGPSFNHYRKCIFYVPETRDYHTTASFDLFPRHCSLLELTPTKHAHKVYTKLTEPIQQLKRGDRKKILTSIHQVLKQIATATKPTIQRVVPPPTSEGGTPIQRVSNAPKITTLTNHTAPATHRIAPCTHSQTTRNNTTGVVPVII